MKMTLTALAVAGLVSISSTAQAADTINFQKYAAGTLASAKGVTFSTAGGSSDGTAVVSNGYFDSINSLNNSSVVAQANGNYPTAESLIFSFSQLASLVSFTYNNYGSLNGGFYTAYNSSNGVISTGNLDGINGFSTVTVSGTDISRLVLDNGTSGNYSWVFGVGQLNFTSATGAVPEPATWAMMLAGFGLIGFAARRRQSVKTTVTYA